jgi:peptidoglycan lytic transglycosylase
LAAGDPLAASAWRLRAVLRPAVQVCAVGLVAATLAACSEAAPPATGKSATVEPVRHISNVAAKGSRLETTAAPIAVHDAEPPATSAFASAPAAPPIKGKAAAAESPAVKGKATYGLASYYSQDSKTASGERFDPREMTAAHRTLPFGTRVRVTQLETGRSVTVRINDRGPYVDGRIVDISRGAAQSLGIIDRGVTKVKLDVLQ